mgnify:CR=1 FL=1
MTEESPLQWLFAPAYCDTVAMAFFLLNKQQLSSDLISEFTLFNRVIRLSKWNSWPFFDFHPVDCRCVEQLPAVSGTHLLYFRTEMHSWKPS